uniref:Uncharacterized protein n=1 Tax=viral metagenome TaxID=1070528 RepID=A0A6M3MDP4_9ZZZZ
MEQMKVEKDVSDGDPDEPPANDFEEKFRAALAIFGLNHKKYEPKIKAILNLIERTGPSRDWLKYYLQKFTLTNKQNIDSIVDYVFIDEDLGGNVPPRPTSGQGNSGGFIQQVLPGGQILLIPSMQQPQNQYPGQPIIINPGGNQSDRNVRDSNDEGTITEVLDEEGKVTKRIIKGGSRQAAPVEKSEDQTLKIITMLKEVGLLQTPQSRTEPQSARIPDEIHQTLDQLKVAIVDMGSSLRDRPAKSENEDIKKMSETVNRLTDQIQTYEKEKRDNETKALKDDLSQVKGMIAGLQDRRSGDAPAAGLSDSQFGTHTQHKNLETITESVTHVGDRITHPLNEILKNQQRMNSLLLVRDIEKQDGVAPGTYMKVLMPSASPGEGEVKATVQKWQDKAAASAGGK